MLLTEDGGEHWKTGPDLPYLIHDLCFLDSLQGFAVGEDSIGRGVILETFDGGLNWDVIKEGLSARLHALHFKDGYGWAVGENGLILRTGYNSPTGAGQDNLVEEGEEHHLWNYPNPFHSNTTIRYQLPETGYVELNIYDFSGRKVSTLIKESRSAGLHETEWNADQVEPGIYFCELKTARPGR